MSKYIIIAILSLTICLPVLSQKKKESKKWVKSKSKLDLDEGVTNLLQEAEALRHENPQQALDKVKDALLISLSLKNKVYEARCYILLGAINRQIEEWELAVENYTSAYKSLSNRTQEYTIEKQKSLRGLALAKVQLKQYNQALYYLIEEQSLDLDTTTQIASLLEISEVYNLLNKNEKASLNLEKAEKLLKKHPNQVLSNKAQALTAKILAQKGETKKAEEVYTHLMDSIQFKPNFTVNNDGLFSSSLISDSNTFLDSYETIGFSNQNAVLYNTSKEAIIQSYYSYDQTTDALNFRENSILLNLKLNNSLEVAKDKQLLGKELLQQGQVDKAISAWNDVIKISDSLKNYHELAEANKALAEVWDKKGNKTRSLAYYKQYSVAMDSVLLAKQKAQTQKEVLLRKQNEIYSLSKDLITNKSQEELELATSRLAANQIKLQQTLIYSLLLLLIITLIAAFLIYRNANKSKIIGQLLHLKSLRSQMNPHFIFNSLNSVNQFIAKNDERAANSYLSGFSKLMRLVLDNSHKDFISLAEEKEILSLYLKLEHRRFRDKFDYSLQIDEAIALDQIEIPPMLIQPYIENAIWHGLRYKEEKGQLNVAIHKNKGALLVKITDNGIGRQKSQELKTVNQKTHQSSGMRNTKERMKIINKVYKKQYTVQIDDLNEDTTGTVVTLTLPNNE